MSRAEHRLREAFFDIQPVTGISIEVFYADRSLETFGRGGAGWFWWPRRRAFAPDCPAYGPFPTRLLSLPERYVGCPVGG